MAHKIIRSLLNRAGKKSARLRRGFSLLDLALTTAIIIASINYGIEFWREHTFRQALQSEARTTTLLAQGARGHVLADYNNIQLGFATSQFQEVPLADIVTTGNRTPGDPDITQRRRYLQVYLYQPDPVVPDNVLILARAGFDHANFDARFGRIGIPRGDALVQRTGVVQGNYRWQFFYCRARYFL